MRPPPSVLLVLVLTPIALAQTPSPSVAAPAPTAPSLDERWDLFLNETFQPITLGAATFNSVISQATASNPLYGRKFWPAYPERFGAEFGDITTQNFFGDFLLASAFHEDTRYVRRGPSYKLWPRITYAISRCLITHTDAGRLTFNWSNVTGSAMSAALSNAYYPPASRTAGVTLIDWGSAVAGSGFANLFPEFWPDARAWFRRHLSPGR